MANVRLANFAQFGVRPHDPTDTAVYTLTSGMVNDGTEIDLGAPINITIDNNLQIPVAQEISLTIPLLDGSSLVTDHGPGATAPADHVITTNNTIANRADIKLVAPSGGTSLHLDNVQVTLAEQIITADGEQIFADVLTITAKEAFGSLVRTSVEP